MNRRDFLKVSSATLAGFMAGAEGVLAAEKGTESAMPYRELGKTGLKVSVIGMGGTAVTEPAVIERAVDSGITLFHTSPGYIKGQSLAAYGAAIKKLGAKRKKIVLAIKGAKLGDIDKELKDLHTDYADLYIPPMEINSLSNPALPEMCAKLKKSGRARFCGLVNHKGMADVMEAALKTKFIEVILATYNMGNRDTLDPVIKKLKAAGVGFIAMKARQGVPKGQDPSSVIRTLLENQDVDAVLMSQGSVQDVDKSVAIPTKKLTLRDRREMRQMMLAMAALCGSCGRCERMCPRKVAVPDIFRFYMYATSYDGPQQAEGVREYRRLGTFAKASNCDDCGACEQQCPNRVPIRMRLKEAHVLLA